MREGLVGKVSGEPLFTSDERSDEAPVERPREESETLSRGIEDPEARFAIDCAISVTERCRWVGAAVDTGRGDTELNATFAEVADDVRMGRFAPTALARLLSLGCCSDVLFESGPEGEKLPVLFTERGRLSAEMSEREESPDGDRERDNACGTADLTDSPEGMEGLDSWAEDEEGEERGSDFWVLGFQACSLFRETEAAHGDIVAKFVASSTIDAG